MNKPLRRPTADTHFISRRQYEAYTEKEWKGIKVELRHDIENGNAKYPAGTVLTIERKQKGFELTGPKCACCGLQPKISSVNPSNLCILDE